MSETYRVQPAAIHLRVEHIPREPNVIAAPRAQRTDPSRRQPGVIARTHQHGVAAHDLSIAIEVGIDRVAALVDRLAAGGVGDARIAGVDVAIAIDILLEVVPGLAVRCVTDALDEVAGRVDSAMTLNW